MAVTQVIAALTGGQFYYVVIPVTQVIPFFTGRVAYHIVIAIAEVCSVVTGVYINLVAIAVALVMASFFARAVADNISMAVAYVIAVTASIAPVAIGRTPVITFTDHVVIAVTEIRPIIA
jgi:hypothetical protein